MTPSSLGPAPAASPSAAGLLGAAGTAASASAGAASGAGGDFLSLVLQMLGAGAGSTPGGEPSTVAGPQTVADAPPAPAGGAPATVPEAGTVADPPPSQEADTQPVAMVPDPSLAALLAGVAPAIPVTAPGTAPVTAPGTVGPGSVAPATPSPATTPGPVPTDTGREPTRPEAAPASDGPSLTSSPTVPGIAAGPVPTSPGAPSTAAPAPVAHQVFDRVVEAIRVSDAGPGPTRVTVRLQPESLGEVRVVMSVRDGALQVSLAGGEPAHHSLIDAAPELRRLLEASGTPDVRVVVRDLGHGTTAPLPALAVSAPAQQAAVQAAQLSAQLSGQQPGLQPGQQGQGASLDLGAGAGQQPGQQPGQHTPDRRAPAHPGPATPVDLPGAATPSRRTDPATRTRTAGVDVTM